MRQFTKLKNWLAGWVLSAALIALTFASAYGDAPVHVAVGIEPLADFVRQVGAADVDIIILVPLGAEIKEDTAIGIFFAATMALGVLSVALWESTTLTSLAIFPLGVGGDIVGHSLGGDHRAYRDRHLFLERAAFTATQAVRRAGQASATKEPLHRFSPNLDIAGSIPVVRFNFFS